MSRLQSSHSHFSWLKGIFITVVSLGIIIYAYIRGRVMQLKVDTLKKVTVREQAPSMVLMQKYTGCDAQCTAAAGLIKQVKRIFETVDETVTSTSSKGKVKHQLKEETKRKNWLKKLNRFRNILINPDNNQYVFVDERIRLKSNEDKPKYTYVTRAHIDPDQINVNIRDAQTSVNQMCKSKKCNLREILTASFENTNLTNKRYAIIDYPWYDSVTNTEIIKRSIIFRSHKHFVVGSGFTLTRKITKPDVSLIALCIFIYSTFLFYVFVFPGLFYKHGEILCEKTLHTVNREWFISKNTYIVIFIICLTLFLAAQHSLSIKKNDIIKTNKLIQQLSDRRYFGILLASLALALGFFTSYQRKYERNILPALFISFLFSLLALLDLFGGSDNHSYLIKIHLTRTFLTCSILTLLWLFTTLTIQWQTHVKH